MVGRGLCGNRCCVRYFSQRHHDVASKEQQHDGDYCQNCLTLHLKPTIQDFGEQGLESTMLLAIWSSLEHTIQQGLCTDWTEYQIHQVGCVLPLPFMPQFCCFSTRSAGSIYHMAVPACKQYVHVPAPKEPMRVLACTGSCMCKLSHSPCICQHPESIPSEIPEKAAKEIKKPVCMCQPQSTSSASFFEVLGGTSSGSWQRTQTIYACEDRYTVHASVVFTIICLQPFLCCMW